MIRLVKTVLATSIAAAAMFAGANASAAVFNPFTVVSPNGKTFAADKITGNYVETATFNGSAFNVSLYWEAGQFVTNQGQTALKSSATGLGSKYGIYALYKASGTITTKGTETIFDFKPGSGSLTWYLDTNNDTELTAAASGSGTVGRDFAGDDVVIANSVPLSGLGSLNPKLSTCTSGAGGSGLNCGSFGSKTSMALTTAGKKLFVAPNSFYNVSSQSGQLNNFNPTGTQIINGSLDVVFSKEVPEPASLALLGLGLAGVGFARRRKQK